MFALISVYNDANKLEPTALHVTSLKISRQHFATKIYYIFLTYNSIRY